MAAVTPHNLAPSEILWFSARWSWDSEQHIPSVQVHISTLKVIICFISMWLPPLITLIFNFPLWGAT